MDGELYDEFGNYIGPELESDEESENEEIEEGDSDEADSDEDLSDEGGCLNNNVDRVATLLVNLEIPGI